MSLFQCENCGCCENTALASQGFRAFADIYDWTRIEDRKGKLLCSACGPERFKDDGSATLHGVWHDEFERVFLPMGEFKTNRDGNLEHIETGSTDFRSFAISKPEVLIVGPGMPPLASKLAAHLAVAEMVLPLYAGHPPVFSDPFEGCRPIKYRDVPQKTKSDFDAIHRAKVKRERKAKKRFDNYVRSLA